MSDDPRDVTAVPGRPPVGVTRTAPAGPTRPGVPPQPPEPAPDPDVEINLVEEERREQAGQPAAPPVEPAAPEPTTLEPAAPEPSEPRVMPVETAAVPPDEAATIELAVSDLHEAARAAGVELQPNVDQPDPELAPDGQPFEPGDPALDGLEPSTGPIDPRIRERRIAVTRAQGRRRLRILLVAVAVASVIGIGWLIVMSPFLAVDDVTIAGTLHESPESVRTAMGVDDGSALLFVDTGAAAARIEKLPWVLEAKVKRELPSGLSVTVVERTPAAWVRRPAASGSPRGTKGAAAIVDATGRVLGDELTPPVGLPEIKGVRKLGTAGGRIDPARPALALALLPPTLREQVDYLTRKDGEPVLILRAAPGGPDPAVGEIRLGRLEDVMAKGAAALAVLEQLTRDEAHMSYIDVRVPGAPATK